MLSSSLTSAVQKELRVRTKMPFLMYSGRTPFVINDGRIVDYPDACIGVIGDDNDKDIYIYFYSRKYFSDKELDGK